MYYYFVRRLVCRRLGYGDGHVFWGESALMTTCPEQAIWLSDVECTGDEHELHSCPNMGWGHHPNCNHSQDVLVRCEGLPGDVGSSGCSGGSDGGGWSTSSYPTTRYPSHPATDPWQLGEY